MATSKKLPTALSVVLFGPLMMPAPAQQGQHICGTSVEHGVIHPVVTPGPGGPVQKVLSPVFDVLAVYTEQARQDLGGTERIQDLIQGQIDQANGVLWRSGSSAQLRLAMAAEVEYDEVNSSMFQALGDFQADGDGKVDHVHNLRDAVGADLVAIVAGFNNGPDGVANVMLTLSPDFEADAFSIVRTITVLTHEIGHNLGLGHNTGDPIARTPYSVGYRFDVGATTFRTMMSQNPGTQINYFSNPDKTFQGVAIGDPVNADAVRNIEEVKATVMGFRNEFVVDHAETLRASLTTLEIEPGADCDAPSVSDDGRYVVFSSDGSLSHLWPGDANGVRDIYLRDLQNGTTVLISVRSNGAAGNAPSMDPVISGDGNFIAYASDASDLVTGDTNGVRDIFLYNRAAGTTTLLNVAFAGGEADADSNRPSIAADGRYVAFESLATNLVSGDVNGLGDVFVRDTFASQCELASRDTAGNQGDGASGWPAISADGNHVAFESEAENFDSDDSGDGLAQADVFSRDRSAGSTTMISKVSNAMGMAWVTGDADSGRPSISETGRMVAFISRSTNYWFIDNPTGVQQVYVRDRDVDEDGIYDESVMTASTTMTSQSPASDEGDADSFDPMLSSDGTWVAFASDATNLDCLDTNGERDIYIWQATPGGARRVNLQSQEEQALGGGSESAAVNADGSAIVFSSAATNLVGNSDTNGVRDIFVRERVFDFGATALIRATLNTGTLSSSNLQAELENPDDLRGEIRGIYNASTQQAVAQFTAVFQTDLEEVNKLRIMHEFHELGLFGGGALPIDQVEIKAYNFTTGQYVTLLDETSSGRPKFVFKDAGNPSRFVNANNGKIRIRVRAVANSATPGHFDYFAKWLDVYVK